MVVVVSVVDCLMRLYGAYKNIVRVFGRNALNVVKDDLIAKLDEVTRYIIVVHLLHVA